MDARQDALVAAARFVDTVHRTTRIIPGRQVATVGRISAERQDWAEAGEYFEKAIALSTGNGVAINADYLAMIFSRAGEYDKAEMYHRKAMKAAGQ